MLNIGSICLYYFVVNFYNSFLAITLVSSIPVDNLAQRIGLASRYYIKNVQSNQQLVPEDLSSELQVACHIARP
jgi:hypothetical protein